MKEARWAQAERETQVGSRSGAPGAQASQTTCLALLETHPTSRFSLIKKSFCF